MSLQINQEDYQILIRILNKYPYQFYAYGSRVKGTNQQFSDLDICYNCQEEDMPSQLASEIKWELEESDLPFKVDLVNWKDMRSDFRKSIQKDLVLI